jgi:hypothetical protein
MIVGTNHPEVVVEKNCASCQRPLCANCLIELGSRFLVALLIGADQILLHRDDLRARGLF